MNPPKVRKDSKSYKILMLLKTGPKKHSEIAEFLGLKEMKIDLDYQRLKKEYEEGVRKSPPRNNIKVYPGLSRVLHLMSRRNLIKNYNNEDQFLDECKPLIIFNHGDGRWYITEFGLDQLKKFEKTVDNSV